MKTSDLTGAELDAWVAKALGYKSDPDFDAVKNHEGYWVGEGTFIAKYRFQPSTNWSQGGPLIEKYKVSIDANAGEWLAMVDCSFGVGTGPYDAETYIGPTPLIAAMRAIVASVFGENVNEQ